MTKGHRAQEEERLWTVEKRWNEIEKGIAKQLSPKQRAAIAEYEEKQRNAWKSVSEFDDLLDLAISCGVLKPLRDYVAAGKAIPDVTVDVAGQISPMKIIVADLLGSQPLPQTKSRGRTPRVPNKARLADQAERNAAWYVAMLQDKWRKENGRKRVPRNETIRIVKQAIKAAAKTFQVSADTIKASNIEALLKSGRFVVRS